MGEARYSVELREMDQRRRQGGEEPFGGFRASAQKVLEALLPGPQFIARFEFMFEDIRTVGLECWAQTAES